jgi:hypothetical protein
VAEIHHGVDGNIVIGGCFGQPGFRVKQHRYEQKETDDSDMHFFSPISPGVRLMVIYPGKFVLQKRSSRNGQDAGPCHLENEELRLSVPGDADPGWDFRAWGCRARGD